MKGEPKAKCPACADGGMWDRHGPTTANCPICDGRAFLVKDEVKYWKTQFENILDNWGEY